MVPLGDKERVTRSDYDRAQVVFLDTRDKIAYKWLKQFHPQLNKAFLKECNEPVSELLHKYVDQAKQQKGLFPPL